MKETSPEEQAATVFYSALYWLLTAGQLEKDLLAAKRKRLKIRSEAASEAQLMTLSDKIETLQLDLMEATNHMRAFKSQLQGRYAEDFRYHVVREFRMRWGKNPIDVANKVKATVSGLLKNPK
jgi:hypothetical protein